MIGRKSSAVITAWCAGLALLYIIFSYAPIVQNYIRTPTDRYYWTVDPYPIDTLGDLDIVRQGYNGAWTSHMRYTSVIAFPQTLVKFDYVLVGHVARWLHIDPTIAMEASRMVISAVYLAFLYLLVRFIIADSLLSVIAYGLVLFAGSILVPGDQSVLAVSQRVFFHLTLEAQHYLASGMCILASLYFLSRTLDAPWKWRAFTWAALLGIIAAFLYGPNVVIAVSTFPLYVLFFMLWKPVRTSSAGQRIPLSWVLSVFVYYAICVAAPILYIRRDMISWWLPFGVTPDVMEHLNPFSLALSRYIPAVGIVYPLGFFATAHIIRTKNKLLLLFAFWLIAHPVGLYFVSRVLNINQFRFFLTPYFVIFGILAALGIGEISRWIASRIPVFSKGVVTLIIVGFVVAAGVPALSASSAGLTNCFCMVPAFGYPPQGVMAAAVWLRTHTKPGDIVLSGPVNGVVIPAFAGNDIYMSWWLYIMGLPVSGAIMAPAAQLYTGRMLSAAAVSFLQQNRIAYILWSDDERSLGLHADTLPYPFLTEVFRQGNVIVYKVTLPQNP